MDDSVDRKATTALSTAAPAGPPASVIPAGPVEVSFTHLHGVPPVHSSSAGGARGGASAFAVSSIAAGYYHCAVVFANGTVATWGRNQ